MEETEQDDSGALPEPPIARIVGGKPREQLVPIEYPVEFDGKVWDAIPIRRITGKELSTYFEKIAEGGDFSLPPVVACPVEVWEAMDADDQQAVDAVATAFMPRRLKAAVELLGNLGEKSSDS